MSAAVNLTPSERRLLRVLERIDDPAARKIVIMAKRERGEITDEQTQALIQRCGLVAE